jgi:stress-induced morphogen
MRYKASMKEADIAAKIRTALPDAQVRMRDLTGTEDHWEATIVSAAFEGKSLIERHRMVFAALTEELKGPIHALSLKTLTPGQAGGG